MVGFVVVGMLVVVAVPGSVLPGVRTAICRVFGGECPESEKRRQDAEFRPSKCLAAQREQKGGYVIKVGFFQIGEEWGFLRQEFSDGTIRLTLTDTASLGVEGAPKKLGASWDTGKLGDLDGKGKREITLAGGLKFGYGDTWTFANADEERRFQDAITEYWAREQSIRHSQNPSATGAGYALKDWIFGAPEMREPDVVFGRTSLEGSVSGAFRSVATNDKGAEVPTGNASLEGKVNPEVIVATDRRNGERQYTYQWTGEGTGAVQVLGNGEELKGAITGAVRITRDKDGRLTKIEFINTYEYTVGGKDGVGGKSPGGNSGSGEVKSGERKVRTTTTVLDVNDANRGIADDWLSQNASGFLTGLGTALPRAFTPYAVTQDPGPNGSPFDRLLYEQSKVGSVSYNNIVDAYKFGLELNLGRTFGIEATYQDNQQNVAGAEYLGAPRNGTRQYVPWPECGG